jgi:hypothetical protein
MVGTPRRSLRLRPVLLDLWPALLAVVLCWPLLTGRGHPLARDLVFVPRQPWTDAGIGLGESAPRAVPLDAVVSTLTAVVDGGLVARLVLPLGLALAGWGTHRLVRGLGTTGRLVAGGIAVWNPYVVERTALGQWALLLGYAAIPWLLVAAGRFREQGRLRDLGATAAWLGLASLTPTGGLLGSATVLVAGAGRIRRTWWLVGCCALLQLPWVLPALVGTGGGTSDPAGVTLFSAGAEGPPGLLGTVVALLGTGGIWDAGSVPASRDMFWGPLTAAAAVGVLLLARRALWRSHELRRLTVLAGAGLVLALASSLPGGDALMRALVEHVPGAGLLRDAQKFVAPYVVLVAAAAAVCADRAVRTVAGRSTEAVLAVAVLAVAAPLMLLPDGARETWSTVTPIRYPSGLDAAAQVMEDGGGGDLATLPWRSYRRFSWGNGLVSSDPAVRWFDQVVVVSDDLQVGEEIVRGESARAARLGASLASGPVAPALAAEGIRWALVYRDDPSAPDLDLTGLSAVYADDRMALYEVPNPAPSPPGPSRGQRALVLAANGVALLAVLGGVVAVVLATRRPRKRPR